MNLFLAAHVKRKWSLAAEARALKVIEAAGFTDRLGPVVYALIDQETGEIRYVGQCANGVGYRLIRHFQYAELGKQWGVSKWLREADYNIGLVILDADPGDPRAVELEWTHRLLEAGHRLTNWAGTPTSEAQKRAASEANYRRWSDPAQRQLLAERNRQGVTGFKGRRHSAEAKEKIGSASRGMKRGSPSLETRRKMSEAAKRRCARTKAVMPS